MGRDSRIRSNRGEGIVNSRTVLIWGRRAVIVAVVVALAIIVRRYDFERLPSQCRDLEGVVRPGAMLVLTSVKDDTTIGVGTIVEAHGEFQLEGKVHAGLFVSRVRGVPGDDVTFRKVDGQGEWEVLVNGEHTWSFTKSRAKLSPGKIPEGHFLLLDPAPGHGGVDSRVVDLVPRTALRRKIISFF